MTIIPAWSGGKWTKAAEIIRYSNAGWQESDITAYAKLLTSVYLPQLYNGSSFNGNWELAMIDAMFGIAVFTDDVALFNHSVTFWLERYKKMGRKHLFLLMSICNNLI